MLTLAVVCVGVEMYASVREFFVDHDGVAFYRERPHLIGLCIAAGVLGGIIIKFVAERWNKNG